MIAFSVAITDASSRWTRFAVERPFQLVAAVRLDLGAELGERVDVRVEAAPADHVAAGRRHLRAPEAGEQRAGEQERRADAARELRVHLVRRDLGGMDAHLVRPEPVDVGAELLEQRQHRLDVAGCAGRSGG